VSLGLQLFLLGIWTQIRQIGLWWLGGIMAGSAISVFMSEKINRALSSMRQNRFSIGAALGTAGLGIVSPVCMFGTIPLIAAIGKKGVPSYLLVTFMVSSIMLNPVLLVMSFSLGAAAALARLLICLLAGVFAGLLTCVFLKKKPVFQLDQFSEENTFSRHKAFWRDVGKSLRVTAPYLLAGIILTALFDQYFPKQYVEMLFGANRGLGILFAVSLSVPLYVCGGGTIPLISAWMQAGMSMGSALAFMVAGPATKITNLGAVKVILGWRYFIIYLGYCLAFAALAGFLADLIWHIS
jgi:uncharacterized protein